jgi:hypothetical protein
MNIGDQHGLPTRGRSADKPFAQRDGQVAQDFFAMPHAVAHAQIFALFVVEQDREQIVRHDAPHNARDCREQLVEIQSLRCDGGDFEQEVQQIAALAEPDLRLNARAHR